MATTWTSFALGGQPKQRLNSFMAALSISATDSYLEFNDVMRADAGVHTAHCDFWDGIDD